MRTRPNPSIERTCSSGLRPLPHAAHVKRSASLNPPMSPRRIFVSYSRADERKVHVLVRLLRTTGAPVFLDVDSIALGSRWRERISEAISVAQAVLVFWSRAANESSEVKAEYEMAISLGREVIPVALDDTPFPPAIAQFNGLSLSEFFVPHDPSFSPHPLLAPLLVRLQGR